MMAPWERDPDAWKRGVKQSPTYEKQAQLDRAAWYRDHPYNGLPQPLYSHQNPANQSQWLCDVCDGVVKPAKAGGVVPVSKGCVVFWVCPPCVPRVATAEQPLSRTRPGYPTPRR